MSVREILPFPRGSTYNEDGVLTLDDTYADHLEGKIYEVPDTVHGTGQTVKLRIVKNDTGATLTVARKFGEFSTDALDWGRRIGTFPADTAGAVVKPVDDAYTVGKEILQYDLFYVVEAGLCNVLTNADTLDLTAGCSLATDSAGLVSDDDAAAGEYVVGQSDVAGTSATAITLVVHVNEGLHAGDAAG